MAGEIDNEAQIHLEAAEISKQIDKNLKALRKNQCVSEDFKIRSNHTCKNDKIYF